MTLPKTDIAVAVYDLHTQAEAAVKALQRSGFDMKKISIIGRDSVLRYETALKADKFMLVVHGGAQEIKRAHELLLTSGLASFDHHRDQNEAAQTVDP